MDSLHYYYYANTNQLKRITDAILPNAFTDNENRIIDIDGQPDSNYVYDAIGNLIKDSAENITDIKWKVYGKIEEITRRATATVSASNIKYTYDAMGNRISQVVTTGTTKNYTWYVRDAQGNILTTYSDLGALDFKLSDRFLYGSSRLGTIAVNESANGEPGSTEFYYENRKFSYDRGYKQYELTNHLGNVLATISDRKFGVSSGGSSLIQYYDPHIVTAQDYYPFGMLSRVALPNSGKDYKFGFNGKLNDNEVKGGLGNQLDFGARIYDPRTGRFFSVDPLTENYPWYSPYLYAGNMPISCIDVEGMGPDPVPKTGTGTYTGRFPSNHISVKEGIAFKAAKVSNWSKFTKVLGTIAKNSNVYVKIADAGIEAYQGWQVFKEMSAYLETLEKEKQKAYKKMYGELVQMKTKSQILSSYEEHNNQDLSQLSDQYLAEVEKRINSGTASEQDRLYQNEITRRKLLLTGGSLNAPSDQVIAARSISYKGFSPGQLKIHFTKHGHEFGNITQAEYLNQAKGFVAEIGENIQEQVVGKFYVKYDKDSRRVLVTHTKDREIRTFYKADGRSENPFHEAIKFAETLSKPK